METRPPAHHGALTRGKMNRAASWKAPLLLTHCHSRVYEQSLQNRCTFGKQYRFCVNGVVVVGVAMNVVLVLD
jgi:hypothetical protein